MQAHMPSASVTKLIDAVFDCQPLMYIVTTGNWALILKRDYFNKVAGGVRQQEKLDAHSELVKIRYFSHGPHPQSACIGSA